MLLENQLRNPGQLHGSALGLQEQNGVSISLESRPWRLDGWLGSADAQPGLTQRVPQQAFRLVGDPLEWQVEDSNLGRLCRRFYRPLPLAARATCHARDTLPVRRV